MRMRPSNRCLAATLLLLLCTTTAHAQPRLATWRATELWRVDGTDAGDGFGDIRDIVVLKDGSAWILDAKDQHIRRYDGNGKPLATIARKGSGPGELQKPNGMVMRGDATVWVNDQPNARLSVFGADGRFVHQYLLSITSRGYRWGAWIDRPTGHLMDPMLQSRSGKSVSVWRRITAAGQDAGIVEIPSCGAPEYTATSWQAETKGKGMLASTYPFMSGGGLAPTGEGTAWCASPRSRNVVLVRIGKNDTVSRTPLDIPPVPVGAVERDSAITRAATQARAYATTTFDAARVPRTKPGVASLHVDEDGRLWVQHGRKFGERSTTYDIHDTRGAHLGRVVVPFAVVDYLPVRARGNDAWVPAKDEDDVVSIVRMRLAR